MKEKLTNWLVCHGVVGALCTKYRFTLRKNAVYTIERFYRFRWQELRVSLNGMHWGAEGQLARFPDVGHAYNGIQTANDKAEDDRLFRQIKSRDVLDADPFKKDLEEEKSAVPPILEREAKK